MALDDRGGADRRLQESWRDELDRACHLYSDNRKEETRAAYLKALKPFTDLVLRNQPPPDSEEKHLRQDARPSHPISCDNEAP